MRLSAPPSVLFFASAAHGLHHVLLALYLTLVLIIGQEWHLPYSEMIALWTLGAMLVGLGSPFAGWLADRIGETKVLVLCFAGLGVSGILCGLARNTGQMEGALALLGLSGSIYHPVGFSWVVKHATVRGRAVAATGIAGSIGVALGPVTAASLASLWGWRMAFILPGTLTLAIGALLLVLHLTGRILDRDGDSVPLPEVPGGLGRTRVFVVLAFTMTTTLMMNSAFLTALPKLVQVSGLAGTAGLFGVGVIAGVIQLLGSGAQFAGGHFADRGIAKLAYLGGFALLALVFPLIAIGHGWGIAAAGIASVFLFESMAPVETMFLARYTPATRRGTVFGIRYALSGIGTPGGVWLVAHFYSPSVQFLYLFVALAVLAGLAGLAAFFLPPENVSQAVPAE
ncbi:MAG: MFS transporter [Alphaproteobacteria bacterium]|nr:MFS transporter [Alphaproteobacteria bacterium]